MSLKDFPKINKDKKELNMSMNELPDISDEKKKRYAKEATKVVCTKGRPAAILYITNCMVENAKLLQEINRLRVLAGEEALPEF
jgi:hypothetical protein